MTHSHAFWQLDFRSKMKYSGEGGGFSRSDSLTSARGAAASGLRLSPGRGRDTSLCACSSHPRGAGPRLRLRCGRGEEEGIPTCGTLGGVPRSAPSHWLWTVQGVEPEAARECGGVPKVGGGCQCEWGTGLSNLES
jgi:hypothetical protein